MIVLDNISKKIGTRVLFEGVSISFEQGRRYGLTGPNGAGKSTLLKIMMGVEEATTGTISLPRRVGFLKQNTAEFAECRVIDAVIMGNAALWAALQERDQLYEQVEMTDAIGMQLGRLEEVIAHEDGYMAQAEAAILLEGMGIAEAYHEEQLNTLPTDLQFRVLLCQALFGSPEALLLDEPTNHLDLSSIGWLEEFLSQYKGSLVVVSHNRHFLNAVTTHIADIDYDTVIKYTGNYDDMVLAKSSIRAKVEAENKAKEKKVTQIEAYIRQFGAGSRASQVRSRAKEIKRLAPQELKQSNIQRPYIRFSTPKQNSGKWVMKVRKVAKSYGDNQVIQPLSFDIMSGDRIALIGNNGAGKTTLLKLLSSSLDPDQGSVELGHQVSLGYFPQNHGDCVDKQKACTAFEWLKQHHTGVYDQEIRSAMGRMLFSGDEALKPIDKLSGGETARLILAHLMLQNNPLLIFDEPNNHLDLEAVSALAEGLTGSPVTVIFASHDQDLIAEVATRVIHLESGKKATLFEGDFAQFLEEQQARAQPS